MFLSTGKTTDSFEENNSAMYPNRGYRCCQLGIAIALAVSGAIASSLDCVIAQVVPDATLGVESSIVTPQIPGSSVDLIQGGATRGANLFHSFEQFSVLAGREAFFNNATDMQNIISRVTGASISNIDGLIRANGTANLFLLNPNGIIFGPNASLNIGGSFLGSTANSLNFADGSQFSATAPQITSLLTVSVPLGLQFGETIGDILNQSRLRSNNQLVGLQVRSGRSLALVGGDVTLDSGRLTAPGGRIELGGLSGAGTVGMTFEGNNPRLEYPNEVARADVSLTNAARAVASEGGAIQVQGRRVRLTGGSQIRNETLGSTPGGTLSVTATELVELIGVDRASAGGLIAEVSPGATGRGSNITIETQRLTIRNGARISTTTRGQGAGGNLEVNASESVELIETQTPNPTVPNSTLRSALFANVGSTGDGGNLTVKTRRLSIRDGATVDASAFGEGDAGDLTVRASESVELSGTSADPRLPSDRRLNRLGRSSSLRIETRNPGEAGNLRIETGQLTVRDGAQVSVSSSTAQGGSAGNLEIAARSIRLDNQGSIQATAEEGNQGNIRLDSQDLVLRNGSEITTNATGTATGGNITINTGVIVAFEDSDISANAVESFGGRIVIDAQDIFGTEFRSNGKDTPESDITASSDLGPQFSGIVEINTPDVDPNQGLITLPAELVDASNQITAGCAASSESIARNEFIITGRGGLPPSPTEPLSGEAVLTEWATLDPEVEDRSSVAPSPNPPRVSTPTQIVEANGWAIAPNGEIILTANAPITPHIPAFCSGS